MAKFIIVVRRAFLGKRCEKESVVRRKSSKIGVERKKRSLDGVSPRDYGHSGNKYRVWSTNVVYL